jgi:putative SOS response-associated peptidase YedK
MCYTTSIDKDYKELEKHFNKVFRNPSLFNPIENNLGFVHNFTPIITNDDPNYITMGQWGLLPSWAKDKAFQNNTLNAKIETITQLPTFKNYVGNRCLIIADGFYEWQWVDEKGKKKNKYFISLPNKALFTFAGLYSDYLDKLTGEIIRTYTMVTTEANALMAEIHNTKKRMPVILTPNYETHWLNNGPVTDFKHIDVTLNAHLMHG